MQQAEIVCPQCQNSTSDAGQRFCAWCRFPLLLVGGRYQLLKKLGAGGMGEVYLAQPIKYPGSLCVIKLIAPEWSADQQVLKRFRREVEVTSLLAKLNPHIVEIYQDCGEERELGFYYVMEYLQGEDLRVFLDQRGTLPIDLALLVFAQLCEALDVAHREGIIHRDLKPQNIFLIPRDNNPFFVKIIDFGLTRDLQSSTRTALTQGVIGTPRYMSPEQVLNQSVDARSDIYSLGILLYEMLTGSLPFDDSPSSSPAVAAMVMHIMQQPVSMRLKAPHLFFPPALEQAILKALAKKPEDRYQNVMEFWQAVAPYQHATPQTYLALPSGDHWIPLTVQDTPATEQHGISDSPPAQVRSTSPYAAASLLEHKENAVPSSQELEHAPTAPSRIYANDSTDEQPTSVPSSSSGRSFSGWMLGLLSLLLVGTGAWFVWFSWQPAAEQPSTRPQTRQASMRTEPPQPQHEPSVRRSLQDSQTNPPDTRQFRQQPSSQPTQVVQADPLVQRHLSVPVRNAQVGSLPQRDVLPSVPSSHTPRHDRVSRSSPVSRDVPPRRITPKRVMRKRFASGFPGGPTRFDPSLASKEHLALWVATVNQVWRNQTPLKADLQRGIAACRNLLDAYEATGQGWNKQGRYQHILQTLYQRLRRLGHAPHPQEHREDQVRFALYKAVQNNWRYVQSVGRSLKYPSLHQTLYETRLRKLVENDLFRLERSFRIITRKGIPFWTVCAFFHNGQMIEQALQHISQVMSKRGARPFIQNLVSKRIKFWSDRSRESYQLAVQQGNRVGAVSARWHCLKQARQTLQTPQKTK